MRCDRLNAILPAGRHLARRHRRRSIKCSFAVGTGLFLLSIGVAQAGNAAAPGPPVMIGTVPCYRSP